MDDDNDDDMSSHSQSITLFSKYHIVMILTASVTTVIIAWVIFSVLTQTQPKIINETNQTRLFQYIPQPVIRNENYTIINIPRPEPCKDDPGVICYVPFPEKLPLPPPANLTGPSGP